jgi:cbb3-type cytochrome oxidase maturation protein
VIQNDRKTLKKGYPVNGLAFLIPIALGLGLLGLAAFFWSLGKGQFDDLDGAALRIFVEDEEARSP